MLRRCYKVGNLSGNLSRNFVAIRKLQEKLSTFLVPQSLREVEVGSTFRNDPPATQQRTFLALCRGVALGTLRTTCVATAQLNCWTSCKENFLV